MSENILPWPATGEAKIALLQRIGRIVQRVLELPSTEGFSLVEIAAIEREIEIFEEKYAKQIDDYMAERLRVYNMQQTTRPPIRVPHLRSK